LATPPLITMLSVLMSRWTIPGRARATVEAGWVGGRGPGGGGGAGRGGAAAAGGGGGVRGQVGVPVGARAGGRRGGGYEVGGGRGGGGSPLAWRWYVPAATCPKRLSACRSLRYLPVARWASR
jgi:hypothetical protein